MSCAFVAYKKDWDSLFKQLNGLKGLLAYFQVALHAMLAVPHLQWYPCKHFLIKYKLYINDFDSVIFICGFKIGNGRRNLQK